MRTFYRDPEVEESKHAIILQNRCGNRLSLLIDDDKTQMEFVYKPNAFRRKEYGARNFSNRDNFTTLFASAEMVELRSGYIKEFDYDPFVTRLRTLAPSGAKNLVTVVNVADENVFAIAARAPMTLAFRPKKAFELSDGLLLEAFSDRGEEIVSFVAFGDIQANRYRVLDDGTHVLQLIADDIIYVGGEENRLQVQQALKKVRGLTLEQLVTRNERIINGVLTLAKLSVPEADLARVLDLNKRFVYSALDEGGACFGAICRIYHLIWTRDGSMSNVQYAMAGLNPLIKIWAPFLLNNPATIRENGRMVTAWQQLFGTRWTKSEDDGLFYATWTLFTHVMTTGDDSLLRQECFEILLRGLDDAIQTRFDQGRGLFASDTRGESSLAASPYYGYDVVNGKLDEHRVGTESSGKVLSRSISLYNNVLHYNVLRMVCVLIEQRPELKVKCGQYAKLARDLQDKVNSFFIDEKGTYRAEYLIYSDGSESYNDPRDRDWWEYAWALSLCPFPTNVVAAVTSAREYVQYWPRIRGYGFCPWNTLAALLFEYGLPSAQMRQMLDNEIREALMLTQRYPMPGLLTEYLNAPEGWRGLPFSASSFNLAITSTLLKPLPQGLAVRAGELLDSIKDFAWCMWKLDVNATGKGEVVGDVKVNGRPLTGSLQIPQSALRPGRNTVEVMRGSASAGPRLYSSTLMLLGVKQEDGKTQLEFAATPMGELVIENAGEVSVLLKSGERAPIRGAKVPNTNLTAYSVDASDGLTVEI